MTIETNSFETIHFMPRWSETTTFDTTFIWYLFIRDHSIWDHVLLRPIHLRPHSHETFSYETTFIWNHIHLRHVEVKLFWFPVYHIFMIYLSFFAEDLKFCKVTIHLKFCKVEPFRVQGWLTLGCKCTLTQDRIKGGQRGQLPRDPHSKRAPVMTNICFK